jgi:hypothetical protein
VWLSLLWEALHIGSRRLSLAESDPSWGHHAQEAAEGMAIRKARQTVCSLAPCTGAPNVSFASERQQGKEGVVLSF